MKTQEPAPRGVFTKAERRLWLAIANTQNKSGQTLQMRRLVKRLALSFGAETVWSEKGNVYATKGAPPEGTPYPAIVAHLDSVFPVIPQHDYEVRRSPAGEWRAVDLGTLHTDKDGADKVYSIGLGGDDKCGIYLALNALRTLPYVKAAFFRDEETGCQGSHEADLTFFDDCAFVLQGDRKGNSDFVDRIAGDISSLEFRTAVAPLLREHGFHTVSGLSTDVGALKRDGLAICAANMSAGYHNYHQTNEYVVEADLLKTQRLMTAIIATMGHQAWAHTQPKQVWRSTGMRTWNNATKTWEDADDLDEGYGWHGGHHSWSAPSPYERDNLTAVGFVEDEQGFWSIPPETEAAILAELAQWPHHTPGGACPRCGNTFTRYENGRWFCQPAEYAIRNGRAAIDAGCNEWLPMAKSTWESRRKDADTFNKRTATKIEREATRAAQKAKDEAAVAARLATQDRPCIICGLPRKEHSITGTCPDPPKPVYGSYAVGKGGVIVPFRALGPGPALREADATIAHGFLQTERTVGNASDWGADANARYPAPETCRHCQGTTMHWSPLWACWVCTSCTGQDTENTTSFLSRKAVRIFHYLDARRVFPERLQPEDKTAIIELITEWLKDPENALADVVGFVRTLVEEEEIERQTDDHDGHDSTPYRGERVQPLECATCGSESITYDPGEDGWICSACRSYTILYADGSLLTIGEQDFLYAD